MSTYLFVEGRSRSAKFWCDNFFATRVGGHLNYCRTHLIYDTDLKNFRNSILGFSAIVAVKPELSWPRLNKLYRLLHRLHCDLSAAQNIAKSVDFLIKWSSEAYMMFYYVIYYSFGPSLLKSTLYRTIS